MVDGGVGVPVLTYRCDVRYVEGALRWQGFDVPLVVRVVLVFLDLEDFGVHGGQYVFLYDFVYIPIGLRELIYFIRGINVVPIVK